MELEFQYDFIANIYDFWADIIHSFNNYGVGVDFMDNFVELHMFFCILTLIFFSWLIYKFVVFIINLFVR